MTPQKGIWTHTHDYHLQAPADHILELIYRGGVIARFSQTGVTTFNLHKAIKEALGQSDKTVPQRSRKQNERR